MLSRTQIIALCAAALLLALGFALTTEWVAHVFGGQAALGSPIIVLGDARIYGPWQVLDWSKRWSDDYSNGVRYGDRRILLVWNRLILPNGWSINLQNMDATDSGGSAGLSDRTDNHGQSLGTPCGRRGFVLHHQRRRQRDRGQGQGFFLQPEPW